MAAPTILGIDGFDHYALADLLKWWSNGTTNDTSRTNIGPQYSLDGWGQGLLLTNNTQTMNLGSNYTGGTILGRFYLASGTLASRTLLVILDGATEQCSIRTDASSRIIVTQNGTQKGGTGPVLSATTTYFFEFQYVIHNSTGTFDLRLNGSSVATSGGNVDLTGTANNYWNGFQLNIPSGLAVWWDSLAWCDTSTGTDFFGPCKPYLLLPAAAGQYAEWTPNGGTNVGNVADEMEDGDTSFNQSSTVNQRDTFVVQKVPFAAGTIHAVYDFAVVRQDAGVQRTVRGMTYDAGGDHVAGTSMNPSTTYAALKSIYQLDPTSAAWTPSTVDANEPGYKLTA